MSKKGQKGSRPSTRGDSDEQRERDVKLMKKYKVKEGDFYDLKEAFTLFDKNRDGTITTAEVGHVLRAIGQNPSNKEVENFIKELDVIDKNGTVNFEEFIKGTPTYEFKSEEQMQDDLKEAFAVFDKNGDGFLNVKELKTAMTLLLGERLDEREAQEMLESADIDGDNRLNYIEFAKQMSAK